MSTTIDGTSKTTSTTSTSGSQSIVTNDTLGKDDFLKLLVTQMQNQDPLNPTDNKDSIAQLAQFSSLEQMNNIASSMNTLSSSMTFFSQQSALTQGSAMIGKYVSGVDLDGTTAIEGTVESVKWLDGDPKFQICTADGSLVDLEMGLITLVKNNTDSTDGTDSTDSTDSTTPATDKATESSADTSAPEDESVAEPELETV
ncbi:flagellar hook capping protein [Desulfosporosinus orientis DSM 765]|uniref:Flagellar hook capping protein n=1 Tax=Desulfosporosinus orientis (strain ATCC 19365 / DSM 765 / NCIMB 8382 / VKM B-1628 / Singapore I) TaxID=768706 RepID=G7WHX0_DESOD|nr:flagellar hook capping FlgD N-terminal domain-containing protein [Desulfosporosinus orientis]AET70267.1 flagellar hook capping protein [Desulfosporosinus orientis DSM 765]